MNSAAEWISALNTPVKALSVDSGKVNAETAFVAFPGARDDGRRHIASAVAAGAAGVFWEAENFSWPAEWKVPNVAVADLKSQYGYLADAVYGEPSRHLPLVAITGTNGKTTVSHLVAQLLQQRDVKSGLIGTLGAGLLGALEPQKNTTPDAAALHSWLCRFIAQGAGAAVLEASSHGIVQGRLNGLRLAAAVFTNAGRDHLDYHKTTERYWQAKAQLFDMPHIGAAILNADDGFCRRLAETVIPPLLTFGKSGSDLRLLQMAPTGSGWRLQIDGILGRHDFELPLMGAHNVYNFMAAALAALVLDMPAANIIQAAASLRLPAGRMQQVGEAPRVYVDYAHTADALAAALAAARAHGGSGRLIAVLGAGGGRDRGKRGDMGRAVAAADVVIVTDDNPRDEDPAQIRAELCRAAGAAAVDIAGRAPAIAAALEQARRGDTVLILGKGHETTQQVGGDCMPFSDVQMVRDWLEKSGACG